MATPDDISALIFNEESLTYMLPRMRKAELNYYAQDLAYLTMYLSLGSLLGTHRFDGYLRRTTSHEIAFQVPNQKTAEIRWLIQPDEYGLDLRVVLSLDPAPLLGAMSFFLPKTLIEDRIGREMEHAFQSVSDIFEQGRSTQSCPVPQMCLLPLQTVQAVTV
jgi:hypothetical protein